MNFIPSELTRAYDVDRDVSRLGDQATRFASAKKSGGGWGGLIGAILGQILIPIPGVGAAIGAGIGSVGGSAIGGVASGVSQNDLRRGKFKKESRADILKTIAGNQFDQSLKNAAIYGFQGLDPNSMFSKGVKGLQTGSAGGGGVKGALKGAKEGMFGGPPVAQVLGDTPNAPGWHPVGKGGMTNEILQSHASGEAMKYDITDIAKTVSDSIQRSNANIATPASNVTANTIMDDMAQNLVQGDGNYYQEYLDFLHNNELGGGSHKEYLEWLEWQKNNRAL